MLEVGMVPNLICCHFAIASFGLLFHRYNYEGKNKLMKNYRVLPWKSEVKIKVTNKTKHYKENYVYFDDSIV